MQPLATLTIAATLAASGTAFTAGAADREFKQVVSTISEEFDAKPMHIPFFGLVNVVARVAKPAGAKHVDLAVFDHLGEGDHDTTALTAKIRKAVGEGWRPFIAVRSNHEDDFGEIVLVYIRPEGHDWKLLVTTVEPDNATVMQVQLDPKGLEKWIRNPVDSALHGTTLDHDDNER